MEKLLHIKQKTNLPAGTRSIQRTIAIIREIQKNQQSGITLSELSRDSNLPAPTVKRILSILILEGFVSIDERTKKYYLGYDLLSMVKTSIPFLITERYHKTLEEIAIETEDTAHLTIINNSCGLCIDSAHGNRALSIPYTVGTRTPLGLIASGIALLAGLNEDEVESILRNNNKHFIEHKLTIEIVRKRVKTCKSKGFIRYGSPIIEGLMNIATPLFDKNGQLSCAIVVSSTTSRLPLNRCKKIYDFIHSMAPKQ